MVRHVVWDWNGTLFDDLAAIVAATSDSIGALGCPPVTVAQYRSGFTRPIRDFYVRLAGRTLSTDEWERVDRIFHDRYRVHMLTCGLTVDAEAALARCAEAGWTQSLLSMWWHAELLPLTGRLGLLPAFARVDGLVGTSGGHKAEHLVRHLDALGVDPAEVGMIGDTVDDALAAESVGATCVLYSGGNHAGDTLRATGHPVADTLLGAIDLLAATA